MAATGRLVLRIESGGVERHVPLVRRFTSVGRSVENSCVLADPEAPECAFHVEAQGGAYVLRVEGDAAVQINGKRRATAILAPGDEIELGRTRIRFEESSDRAAESDARSVDAQALEKLLKLSQQLLGRFELDGLLETMMDQVIELCRADKGLLILLEGNERRVCVARGFKDPTAFSDAIIEAAVATHRPMIVADAANDDEFKASESVVNLKLASVMCAPLMEKGELFGLLYVGNDRFPDRFTSRSLALLETYAGIASLVLRSALVFNELKLDNVALRRRLEERRFGEIVGACAGMKEVFRMLEKIASTDISVLITGETGTGKELIARELHKRSQRASGPFVTLNCGAIPEALLESELFGHVRGAFTGAIATREGRFQAANKGTLFLDEIGELPLLLQVKLLRALQEKQVTKIGNNRAEPVDIRIVAATNRVLEDEIRKGAFREDLFYRVNVIALALPPLRERGEDIAILAKWFLHRFAEEFGSSVRGFTPGALSAMRRAAWPGNIRELENRVKKAVVMADRALISAEDLGLTAESMTPVLPLAQAKEAFQKRYIDEVLNRNGGNRAKTARELGVDPRTIFRHLEKAEAERLGRTLPPDPMDSEDEEGQG